MSGSVSRWGRVGLVAIGVAAVMGGERVAVAAPGDSAAQKLISDAMGNDYLATNFAHAEKKLRRAVEICGPSRCTKDVLARVHYDLAVVLIVGRKKDGRAELARALEIEPQLKLDPDFATDEVRDAYRSVKLQGAGAAAEKSRAKSTGVDAPEAQRVGTPIPLQVVVPVGVEVKDVRVRYKHAGGKWKIVLFHKHGAGFVAEIPCDAVGEKGDVLYYVQSVDADGAVTWSAGAADAPLTVELRDEVDEEPHAPGEDPPKACGAAPSSPSSPAACEGAGCGEASKPSDGTFHNWFGVYYEPDLSFISGNSDVCNETNQVNGSYSCFRKDGTQYHGTPERHHGDTLNGGLGFATSRVVLSFDRVVTGNLTFGARFGYVVSGGGPKADGADVSAFLPIHAELRLGYWFGDHGWAKAGLRPFVFLSGGLAQVDQASTVPVREDRSKPPPPNQLDNPSTQELDVYVRMGRGFGAGGGGIMAAVTPRFGIFVDAKAMVLFPSPGFVIAPEAGIALGL